MGDNGSRYNVNINTVEKLEELDNNAPNQSESPVLFNRQTNDQNSRIVVGIEAKKTYTDKNNKASASTNSLLLSKININSPLEEVLRATESKSPVKETHITKLRKQQKMVTKIYKSIDNKKSLSSSTFNIP